MYTSLYKSNTCLFSCTVSCGKVLQSSNFNFYIAGKNSLAIQDFIFIFIFFLIAIFTLPIIA